MNKQKNTQIISVHELLHMCIIIQIFVLKKGLHFVSLNVSKFKFRKNYEKGIDFCLCNLDNGGLKGGGSFYCPI